jgi:hypothetical protein
VDRVHDSSIGVGIAERQGRPDPMSAANVPSDGVRTVVRPGQPAGRVGPNGRISNAGLRRTVESRRCSVNGVTTELRTLRAEPTPDAVVWVDERHAIVARADVEGIATTEVRRVGQAELRYLARVVHEIGDRQHVMIVGPQPIKLALEREFVAISHRPDRLTPPPPDARNDGVAILDRFERLAA